MNTNPKRLGKYELLERLGQGGMAEVWKGFDPQLRRSVAIKFLHANLRSDADFTSRFQREGQAIAALRHPNIVQVYDFHVASSEDEGPMAYMVMDYVEGSTLAEYLRRTSYALHIPSPEEIVHLFTSLGLAVDYAHQQRMIHRDIKPANILLDARNTVHNSMGEPILTDFGIVKMLGTAAITSTGIAMGTPLYISPEQVHGQASNERSDIYALGVILYEMCTGKAPYSGDNPYVILAQRISGPPSPPSQHNPELPPEMDAVLLRCLALDAQQRFPSASMLTAALAQALHVPVPDLVRHALSSSHLEVLPTSPHSSQPIPLAMDTIPDASSPDLQYVKDDKPAAVGDKTVVSHTGPSIVSTVAVDEREEDAPEYLDSAQVVPSTPVHSSSSVTLLPSSGAFSVAPTHRLTTALLARQRNLVPIFGSIILLVMFIGGSIGVYTLWHSTQNLTMSLTSVGSATFFNSGQSDGHNMLVMNDGVQVSLHNVANPAPGQRYYAWLQDPVSETPFIALGTLNVTGGNASLSYTDQQHRDLLALMSRFLVTEQPMSVTPKYPPLEKKLWRYYATLPQTASSASGYLEHLRQLLSSDPALSRFHQRYGLGYWLMNATEELYKHVIELRDGHTPQSLRQGLANVLYSLDGQCAQQEIATLPPAKNDMFEHRYDVSLLDCAQGADPPGYLTHVTLHLNGMVAASGGSTQEAHRAVQINQELSTLQGWMKQMRTDILQLAHLDNPRLEQKRMVRTELEMEAMNVIGGHLDPTTQTLQPGMVLIFNEMSTLASFEVSPYTSK